eukprot:CAMPEP_0206007496 /NCGR_PEP_ID=MMETSP1464-20131121/5803_1 /ASSEMBLY_ACC=CAM_ASM_001124 /TAXON_ID=119497 /ORGANISM="Exanthemachrysis gayraliae, Strain RCC1523" /LENGTH=314 /DNA_ID=CAMNT_0053380993 /DNA_START=196 /DNA_END=1137 /DNA_ORIENTATION=+
MRSPELRAPAMTMRRDDESKLPCGHPTLCLCQLERGAHSSLIGLPQGLGQGLSSLNAHLTALAQALTGLGPGHLVSLIETGRKRDRAGTAPCLCYRTDAVAGSGMQAQARKLARPPGAVSGAHLSQKPLNKRLSASWHESNPKPVPRDQATAALGPGSAPARRRDAPRLAAEPRVLQRLRRRRAPRGVHSEAPPDKGHRRRGHALPLGLPKVEEPLAGEPRRLRVVVARERLHTRKEDVGDDAHAEHVRAPVVGPAPEDLRRGVARGAAARVASHHVGRGELGEAKVAHLDHASGLVGKLDVLQLEVAVQHPVA